MFCLYKDNQVKQTTIRGI